MKKTAKILLVLLLALSLSLCFFACKGDEGGGGTDKPSGGDVVDPGDTPEPEAVYHQLTFDMNGGSQNNEVGTQEVGKPITVPKVTPTRTGYSFLGWFDNAESRGTALGITYFSDFQATADVTLYAGWTPTNYHIVYMLNGGQAAVGNPTEYNVESASITFRAATRTGYTFAGWWTGMDADAVAQDGILGGSMGDVTVYARWTANTYTVSYELGGGTNAVGNLTSFTTESDTSVLNAATRTGYDFLGWFDAATAGNRVTAITQGSVGNRVLYARWSAPIEYAVTYNTAGGEGDVANPVEYNVTEAVTFLPATRTGYDFLGWFSAAEGGNAVTGITAGSTGAVSVFAHWSAPIEYAITYHLDGGTNSAANPATYNIEDELIRFANPSRVGYTFGGWYTTSAAETLATPIAAGSTGAVAVYASWNIITYSITYHTGEGINSASNPATYNVENEAIVLVNASREGYYFNGWFVDTDCQQRMTSIQAHRTGNIVLYAKFTKIYTLNDANANGIADSGETVFFGSYPQTIVTDTAIIAALSAGDGVTTDASTGWLVYNENRYAKVTASTALTMTDGTTVALGTDCYFEVQPIEWEILTNSNNTAYLMAKLILDCQAFLSADKYEEISGAYMNTTAAATAAEYSVYAGNWEYSDMRAWLNNTFYTNAFNSAENQLILEKTIENGDTVCRTDDYATCRDTADHIFLLSYADAMTSTYGFRNHADEDVGRQAYASDYTRALGIYYNTSSPYTGDIGAASWYLRTIEDNSDYVTAIGYRGATEYAKVSNAVARKSGVRPALYLNLSGKSFGITAESENTAKGTVTGSGYGNVGETLTITATPNAGYTFDGWYLDGTRVSDTASFVVDITAVNKTYIAKYAPITYDISFVLNAEVTNPNAYTTYTLDDAGKALAEPTYEHHSFVGWYMNAAMTGSKYTVLPSKVGGITLYARWTPDSYAITYDLRGGTAQGNPLSYNADSTSITLKDATKLGYTFEGWFTASGTKYTAIEASIHSDLALVARWSDPIPYTISYVMLLSTDTTTNPTAYDVETRATLVDAYARDGYDFRGWFQNARGAGSPVTELDGTIVGNITLYAVWAPTQYDIVYVTGEGTKGVNPNTYGIETEYTFGDGIRHGYEFLGWFDASEGGAEVTGITLGSYGETITLYARWSAPIQYTVSYENILDGTNAATNPTEFNVTDSAYTLADATRTGYTFGGWFDAEDYTGTARTAIAAGSFGNITVYAKWTAVKSPVTFVANYEDAPTITPITQTFDAKYILPTEPTRTGYTFAGWWTQRGTAGEWGTEITADTTVSVVAATTVYAKWQADVFAVTFDLNYTGSVAYGEPIDQTYDSTYVLPVAPTRTGYVFSGWYAVAAGTGDAITASTVFKLTTATILYAKWTAVSSDVTFDANYAGAAAITPIAQTFDAKFVLPTQPERTGYTFAGWWTLDGTADEWGTAVTAGTIVTVVAATTVYAKWTPVQISVTFALNDGTTNAFGVAIAQTYDAKYVLPTEEPTRRGYTFAGWYAVAAGTGEAVTADTTVQAATDISLYAKWTTVSYSIEYKYYVGDKLGIASVPTNTNVTTYNIETPNIMLVAPSCAGYTFVGWYKAADFVETLNVIQKGRTGDVVVYGKFTAAATTYSVKYYKQNITRDGFELATADTQVLPCTTEQTVSVDVTSPVFADKYADFTIDTTAAGSLFTATALGDGSTTLSIYYVRDAYSVEFYINDGVTTEAIGTTAMYYGQKAVLYTQPTRTGYTFASWNTASDGTGDTITTDTTVTNAMDGMQVYAQWTPNTDTAYTVEHYVMKEDGTYTLADTDDLTGTTDATLTLADLADTAHEITDAILYNHGTQADETVLTAKIAADGSTLLKLYYDRQSFAITYTQGTGSTLSGAATAIYGATVSFTATATAGYENVTVTYVPTSTVLAENNFVMPASAVELRSAATLKKPTATGEGYTGTFDGEIHYLTVNASHALSETYALTYIWKRDGIRIEGATSSTLEVWDVVDTETYSCVVTIDDTVSTASFEVTSIVCNITAKQLTVSDTLIDMEKEYDGTTASTVSSVGTLEGVIGEDDVTLSATAAYADKNVGEWKTVTVTYTIDGADKSNYLAPVAGTFSADITAIQLTVSDTLVDMAKEYDGTTESIVSSVGTLAGVIGEDDVTLSATAVYADKDVGEWKVVTVTYTIDGADKANYLAPVAGTFSADITAKQLTATDTAVFAAKEYDGTTESIVSSVGTLAGVIGEDDVTLSATAVYADKNVGTDKAVTVTYTIDGADKANYLAPVACSFTVDIFARMLSVSSTVVVPTKEYDGTTDCAVTGVGTLSGVLPGETVTLLSATAVYADKNVGTGKDVTVTYTLDGADKANYIAYSSDMIFADITAIQLTVSDTLVDMEKEYDGTTESTVSSVGTLAGVIGEDDVTLSATAVYADKNVGEWKAVTVTYTIDGADKANYLAPVANSTFTADITAKQLTVNGTVITTTKAYDGTTECVVTVQGTLVGVAEGEDVTLTATAEYADKNVGTDKVVTVTYEKSGTDRDNYIAPDDVTFTADITAIQLTVSDTLVEMEKEYDGTTESTVSSAGTLAGVIGEDDVTLVASAEYADKNVGEWKIVTVTYTIDGADKANYLAPVANSTFTADITAKQLTVTGTTVASSKPYDGNTDCAVSEVGTLAGVIGGEVVTLIATAEFDDPEKGIGKPVTVTYTIAGADKANYLAPVANSTFTSDIV